MKKLKILFWKTVGIVITDTYNYSNLTNSGFKVLYECDEKGKHWIVISR